MSTVTAASTPNKPSVGSYVWAVLLMVTGIFAVALPWEASLGVALVIGWLFIVGCVFQGIHAFKSKGVGSILWKLLLAVLYLVTGLYFLAHPLLGLATLTFVLAIFFLVTGVMDLVVYFKERNSPGAGWTFWNGAVTLILGFLIWRHWPSSSLWVIGTLLGIHLMVSGLSLVMTLHATRRLRVAPA